MIPAAARAAVCGHVADQLTADGNPQAELIAKVSSDMVLDAAEATGWELRPAGAPPEVERILAVIAKWMADPAPELGLAVTLFEAGFELPEAVTR